LSAVALLCEIIAQQGKAAVLTYGKHPYLEALLRGGFVRRAGVVQSVVCLDCDSPHDAEIVYEKGGYGYFCPDLGFVPLERALIEAVVPDFPSIVGALADGLDCKRRKSTPVQGATWRIGVVASEGGDVSLYLHASLRGEEDVAGLMAALSREVRTPYRLILTANGVLPIPDAKTALLVDVAELHPDQGRFAVLTDPRDIVDAPRKRLGGAPNRHKETLVPLIQARIQNGSALQGRNEEAIAILDILRHRTPDAKLPSLPTIRRYLTEARNTGS